MMRMLLARIYSLKILKKKQRTKKYGLIIGAKALITINKMQPLILGRIGKGQVARKLRLRILKSYFF